MAAKTSSMMTQMVSSGVQLLEGNRVIDVNQNSLLKPDAASIIWDNIQSVSETKMVTAKLRCAESNPVTLAMVISLQH
ncbi:hypothetical protein [Providencia huaxiensis]|uniref:hypothetical protein n=1 Tax=Providencia huaxiensis TaxID=2027290 RepID=UPI0034DCCA72